MARLGDMRYMKGAKRLCDFGLQWDIFISAFNGSSRVSEIYDRVSASRKFWVLLPEYGYAEDSSLDLPMGLTISSDSDEDMVAEAIISQTRLNGAFAGTLCVDITGFMRPHIFALVARLRLLGIKKFDVIYTEPGQYKRKEHTAFVDGDVDVVRQVIGFEGVHSDEVQGDVLIVGVGYDDALVSRVANDKDSARFIQLLSLPSLSADMYQESILRLDRSGVSDAGDHEGGGFFAPANDPFVVADEISRKVAELNARSRISNLYLSPLATKPQALGFALYYLAELSGKPASILFPFAKKYERETSVGVGATWLYEVEY